MSNRFLMCILHINLGFHVSGVCPSVSGGWTQCRGHLASVVYIPRPGSGYVLVRGHLAPNSLYPHTRLGMSSQKQQTSWDKDFMTCTLTLMFCFFQVNLQFLFKFHFMSVRKCGWNSNGAVFLHLT